MSISKKGEAKRLHNMGFGVHWLRPNSKVPVESGWSGDSRDTISSLLKKYQNGYNVGTKLGKPSKIDLGDGTPSCYLAAIDVDVKGLEKRHKKEARAWVENNFPGLLESAPFTISGRGNGSMHVWCLVQSPMDSRKLTSSGEIVKVHMPSVTPSKNDKAQLSQKEIDAGFRMRPAWEVDFMCAGRQVVLPPSIHPDSGKMYRWGRPLESVEDLNILTRSTLENIQGEKKSSNGRPKGGTVTKIDIVDVEESVLEEKLTPKILSGIFEGEEVEDRSAFCLTIALSMVREKFTDAEILGVLTNKDYFIGDVAYDHAKTSNRARAARWAYDYCVRKARMEADTSKDFESEVKIYDTLPKEKADKQVKRLVSDLGRVDWKKKLDRDSYDKIKPTFKNVKLILENVVSPSVFIYDEFSRHQRYGVDTPWGGKRHASLEDKDEILIKDWFAHNWKIEPHTNLIAEVIVQLSSMNLYHPVKEYLEGLEWDGVPRLDSWLATYLGADGDEAYLAAVGRKFLVAAVARIYEPGRKFDHMPILEGKQGAGKSTVGRVLASDKWFYDSELNLNDKDSALNLQGQWLIEMGELAGISRADVRTIKSFITRQVDKVRPPYGKRMVESARQCVFFGTTNDDAYLKDKTGNRRFWPVNVPNGAEIDIEGLREARDQLWAEALMAYDMGETLYLDKEIESLAKDVQESRVIEDVQDVMLDKLGEWKDAIMKARKARRVKGGEKLKPLKFKLIDLFEEFPSDEFGSSIQSPLKEYKSDNNLHLQWTASCLKKLGFEKYPVSGRNWWRIAKK
jgi:predicted P-loop ATPase